MKKVAIFIMVLFFSSCTGGLVQTQNGSFKSILKDKYSEKSCYKFTNESGELKLSIMVAGIDVDQAIRICTVQALKTFSRIRANRLTNEGLATIPSILAIPRYREGAIVGIQITVIENIPHKEYRLSINNQEWTVAGEGRWHLSRENISDSESWSKHVRYTEKLLE